MKLVSACLYKCLLKVLDVLITTSFLIYCSSAARSTERAIEWRRDFAKVCKNLLRMAESKIRIDRLQKLTSLECELIDTRFLTCRSIKLQTSRFFKGIEREEGLDISNLKASESSLRSVDVGSFSLYVSQNFIGASSFSNEIGAVHLAPERLSLHLLYLS